MSMENKEGPEKFSFLQEVIKEKPLNRKKLMHKAAGWRRQEFYSVRLPVLVFVCSNHG